MEPNTPCYWHNSESLTFSYWIISNRVWKDKPKNDEKLIDYMNEVKSVGLE